jgi:tetratricopeptide (TPR) repeat protein
MYKLCLTLVCLVISGSAIAQRNTLVQQAPYYTSGSIGSINIAVSGMDDADGDSYFEEAEKNEKTGDLNDALTFFAKAAFEYNNSGNFNRYGASLLRLSNVHCLLEHYTEAEQVILNVALKSYSRIGSRAGQMASYNQLGKVYLAANKLTQSLWFYTQQGILARQINNTTSYIDSILGIAEVKIKKKEYSMAAKDINRAELFARSSKINQFKGQIKQARSVIAEKSGRDKQSK